jgi:aldehyde dehydrogenase (NAD+)
MREHERIFIDGSWIASKSDRTIEVFNPSTEELIARVADGTAADVDLAVEAARRAWGPWSALPGEERVGYLRALFRRLGEREDDFVTTIATDIGVPLKMARRLQFGLPMSILEGFTDTSALPTDYEIANSLITHEPIGVVGAITPWNYPLHQTIAKLAPALAAGCTIVLKPSEVTPLTIHLLAEAIEEIELPPGVVNLISGTGEEVGAALAGHPDVDMISFTGSTRAGSLVAQLAGRGIKRVALELGGKSPNVILPDVTDLERVVKSGVGNCYLNSGQTCLALTRMLVHKSQYSDAVEIATQTANGFTLGDPFDPGVKLGPMTSAAHRERVRNYIEVGIAEGARLAAGGVDAPAGLDRGFFVRPAVFADVDPAMRIAQEEIFGPVLCIMSYDDEEHAIEIANGTQYGLTAGVWSADDERALRVARRLRSGQVDVNGGAFNPRAPFGGYKRSGVGRELGPVGVEEFMEVKAIQR